jgi:hypothetical protein
MEDQDRLEALKKALSESGPVAEDQPLPPIREQMGIRPATGREKSYGAIPLREGLQAINQVLGVGEPWQPKPSLMTQEQRRELRSDEEAVVAAAAATGIPKKEGAPSQAKAEKKARVTLGYTSGDVPLPKPNIKGFEVSEMPEEYRRALGGDGRELVVWCAHYPYGRYPRWSGTRPGRAFAANLKD